MRLYVFYFIYLFRSPLKNYNTLYNVYYIVHFSFSFLIQFNLRIHLRFHCTQCRAVPSESESTIIICLKLIKIIINIYGR